MNDSELTENDYTIRMSAGITTIRVHRKLNLSEYLELMKVVAESENENRRLWQVTECFALKPDEVNKVASQGRVTWTTAARVAFVAADDLSFGLLRMLEVYREQDDYQTKVFRDEVNALAWLKSWDK